MPVNQNFAVGIDISAHNGKYTHRKPLDFICMRSSIGYQLDTQFRQNLVDTQMIPIRGAYYYSFVNHDWKRQADTFLASVAGTGMHFLALDYESAGDNATKDADDVVLQSIKYLERKSGLTVILYSGLFSLAKMYARGSRWVLDVPLWVARWFGTSTYNKPKTVSPYSSASPSWASEKFWAEAKWDMWQYGGDVADFSIPGKGQGAEYGVLSDSIDLNAYNGTVAKMRADLNIGDDATSVPEPPSADDSAPGPELPASDGSEEHSMQLPVKVIARPRLNIRTGPGTTFPKVGSYANGQEIVLLDIKRVGVDWWGLTDKGWIAGKWRGERFTDL